MKMEFVDEAELQKAADEPEDEVRGRIVLVGEPMGLFIAEELGELEDVKDRVILVDSVSKRFSACGGCGI